MAAQYPRISIHTSLSIPVLALTLVIATLVPVKAGDDPQQELLLGLLASKQDHWRAILSNNRPLLTPDFLAKVKQQVRGYCSTGKEQQALRFWEMLRIAEDELSLEHQVLVTECDFEGVIEIGIYSRGDFHNPSGLWEYLPEDLSIRFASAESDFSRGYSPRARQRFLSLLASGYQPNVCALYLELIDKEFARFGDL